MAQHRATLRRSLRSALKHKKIADELLDQLKDTQEKMNATFDKLEADSAIALDTDYAASGTISDPLDPDATVSAQHKGTFSQVLKSSLSHAKLALEISAVFGEIQNSYNALLSKLDAEGGTLNDTDYESLLTVPVTDMDSRPSRDPIDPSAPHGASFRRSMRSALSHKRLADQILDSIVALQEAHNAALAVLDGGSTSVASLKVTVIDPDAE